MEITEKLNYIGLDLKNVPEFIKESSQMKFRPTKNYIEKNYKAYKYVDVNKIKIFLTPTNRLSEITDKYSKAIPLFEYLSTDTEEGQNKNSEFLNMLENTEISDIEELEKKQKQYNEQTPYSVKFHKDYLWQIYYSDATDKFFMLVPTAETEYEAMFYVLKKQLENKETKIYVPICYTHYTYEYLSQADIEEIENELWFFTKSWPQTYEVTNIQNQLTIQIVGTLELYDTIQSEYKIILKNREEALDFYKFLKALFMLQSKLPHCYKFKIKLNQNGDIEFHNKSEKLSFDTLPEFIKTQCIKAITEMVDVYDEKINLEKKSEKLKQKSNKLDQEYYEKEKQITTFLECKKTFFGKVRYFIKYKKSIKEQNKEEVIETEKTQTLHFYQKPEIKEYYTLEEMLEIYKELDKEKELVVLLKKDIEAMQDRIKMITQKLENAKLYIKKIDEHKKSIFEFWKFTNKDETKQLNKGEVKIQQVKLKKTFNIKTDFEDLAKKIDKLQREKLTKEEIESIFLANTEILEQINSVENIKQEDLEKLKNEIRDFNFDVFEGMATASNETKKLGNNRHRETEREKLSVLRITKTMELQEYIQNLNNIAKNLERAIKKCSLDIELPLYKLDGITGRFNNFYLEPQKHIKYNEEINLYKIMLKETTNAVASTNIVFYNNINQTLPLGMNVTDSIILDMKEVELKEKDKEESYIVTIDKEEKAKIIKLNMIEYMY